MVNFQISLFLVLCDWDKVFCNSFCLLRLRCLLFLLNCVKALQFTPRLKGVLSRVLPILGNVRDIHRPIFANGAVKFSVALLVKHVIFDARSRKRTFPSVIL